MDYDNERDSKIHGYDAGLIVDGEVVLDPKTNRYVLLDEDGKGFDSQEVLKSLLGKQVRMTMVSFESMDKLENILNKSSDN